MWNTIYECISVVFCLCQAKEATDAYYHNLRQAEIRNAWDHWDRLYAETTLPKNLQRNFRVVYSAYSPTREEEAFVVCPWAPGPFRFVRLPQKPLIPDAPKNVGRTGRGPSPVKRSSLLYHAKNLSGTTRVNSPIMHSPLPMSSFS